MSGQRTKVTPIFDPSRGERLLGAFDLLRKDSECSKDFTLVCQGSRFPVHKQLLSLSSEYFQGCFRSGMLETRTDAMQLPCVSPAGLQQVLDFMYTGGMTLSRRIIGDVLDTAVFLRVHDAVALCCQFMLSQLKMKSVSEYHQLAEAYQLDDFCAAIDSYVLRNFHRFIKTDEFVSLSPLRLVEYLKDDRLCCSEFKLYKALERWVHHDLYRREICTELILSYVKFALMSNEELNRLRKSSEFFENELFQEFIDEAILFRCAPLRKQILSTTDRARVRSVPHIVGFAQPPGQRRHSCILLDNKWYDFDDGLAPDKSFINASFCTFGDFMFACGVTTSEAPNEPSKVCYCFKPHSFTWTRIANMRFARRGFALVAHGRFVYAIGGLGEGHRLVDSVERYDIGQDRWSYVCAMGVALSDMACCCLGDVIYLAGGLDDSCTNVSTFKTFLPRISMWQTKADVPGVKFKPKMFPSKDRIFLVDLYKTDGIPTSIDCYSILFNQWTVLEATSLSFSRSFSAVRAGDWIYFVGRNEVEDGHSKRFNVVSQKTEEIADFPWSVDAPMCATLKLPFNIIKTKALRTISNIV